jgi:hypothetical protein
MPLINLTSNLKNLKFGHDRIDGGNSNQPYIKTPIPEGDFPPPSPDFVLRGGLHVVRDTTQDILRLGKYFVDLKSPSGFLFNAKQNLLSRTAVRTQASGILNEGFYTPLSTLAEASLVAFGGHVNKQGINPFEGPGAIRKYADVIKSSTNADDSFWENANRLNVLYGYKILNDDITIGRLNGIKVNEDGVNILTYTGGPGSILGIGNTNIKFATDNTGAPLRTGKNNTKYGQDNKYTPTINYNNTLGLSVSSSFAPLLSSPFNTGINEEGQLFSLHVTNDLINNIAGIENISSYQAGIANSNTNRSDIESQIKRPLGLSVSSSFASQLSSSSSTGINEIGQLTTYHATNKLINNIISESISSYQVGIANSKTNRSDIESQIKQPLGVSKKWKASNGSSSLPPLTLTYSSGSDPYYAIRSQSTLSTGYLNSSKTKNNITSVNSFELATSRYNQYIASGSSTIDNLLQNSSFKSSINGSGSNWYYTIGGGGVGIVGNQLSGYVPPTSKRVSNAYGTSTNNDNGDSATYIREDFLDPNITPQYSINFKIQDFRKILRSRIDDNLITPGDPNSAWNILSSSPEYSGPNAKNIEKRNYLGDPGSPIQKNLKSYTDGASISDPAVPKGAASVNSFDKINASKLYQDTKIKEGFDDLINFRIGVLDNNNPSKKTYIHFRAFLDQISDGYTANWQDTQYIGRGEKFYNYTGFDRKVSLSWTVAAQSKAELIPMYKRLNYLASIITPDYSSDGYMRGNIVTLTVGGYFREQPGIITGFSYEMNGDNSTWEIGINDEGDKDTSVKQMPHSIKVSGFNFTPIHTFVPRKQSLVFGDDGYVVDNGYGPERYIALEDDDGNTSYGPPPLG